MMNSLNDLYDLVHSMTMNEKRYFRLFAAKAPKDEDPHYLQLFEILNKSDNYTQANILKKLSKTSFYSRLSYTQNYLHNQIMDVLRQFRRDKTSASKVTRLLEEVKILFDNCLIRKAASTLRRARKELDRNKDEAMIPLVLNWEDTCLRGAWNGKVTKEKVARHLQNRKDGLEALEYQFETRAKGTEIISFIQSGHDVRREEIRSELSNVLQALEDRKRPEQSSASTYFGALTTMMLGNFALGKLEKALDFLEIQHGLIAENSTFTPLQYTEVMSNYYMISAQLGKSDLCDSIAQEVKNFEKKNKSVALVHQNVNLDTWPSLEITKFTYAKDFKAAKDAAEKFELVLKENGLSSDLNDFINLAIPIPLAYFHAGDYQSALNSVNFLLDNFEWGNRTSFDHEYFLRLLEIMSHFEIGSIQILESKLRSLKRFLKANDRLYCFETIFIRLYKALIGKRGEEEERLLFLKAKEDLKEVVTNDPMEDRMQHQILMLHYLEIKAKSN